MSPQLLQQLFTADALWALAPLIALCLGAMLVLLSDILPGTAGLRRPLFLLTIAAAAYGAVHGFGAPEGTYMMGSFHHSHALSAWTVIFLLSGLIAFEFGQRYYKEEARFLAEHDVLMLTSLAGMVMMAGAADLLAFFIGLETLSVPLYTLAGFRRARSDSVEAGLKYFMLGAFAAAMFLYGAALVYAATGTISIEDMSGMGSTLTEPLALAGFALIVGSLFFKISVFPFHLWVPDVYQGAPTPVTAFMATGTKAAGFAFLLTLMGQNLASGKPVLPESAAWIVGWIAVITMAAGNLGALVQTDLKRMLAYSGVAHAGTMLLAIAAGWHDTEPHGAQTALLFYMAAYVFTAGGAFGLLAWMESEGGEVTIESLKGLSARRPMLAAAMAVFMLSLGGIPPLGGFWGKYLVFSCAVRADMIPLAVIGVLMSVIALGYYLKVIVAMYMQPQTQSHSAGISPRLAAAVATGVCALVVVALGMLPSWVLERLG
ncbi:MAG: NADH-quinone oxidoreductase subunit N [Planctomycetes bacterium]|nr:NADH-quinone oxidoreductase subunit N [Planctomycetota bacterium]